MKESVLSWPMHLCYQILYMIQSLYSCVVFCFHITNFHDKCLIRTVFDIFLPISILPPPSLNYRANSLFFWLKDALCRKVKSLLKRDSLLLLPRLRTFPSFTFTVKLKWHYCDICLLLKPFIENSCKSFARLYPGKYYHLWEILRYVSIWLHQGIKPRNIDCTIWV